MGLRIVRATGATFGGTTLEGITRAAWQISVVRKPGRSDGERGDTTVDKTFHRVTGWVETDDEIEAESVLLTNALGALVINWRAAGGTAKTMTIGNGTTSGVVFVGSQSRIAEGSEGGPTTRTRANFIGQFDASDTTPTVAELAVTA